MNSTCAKDGGRRQTMEERILLAKRKNTSNSASKSGMFFHFAVKFELFKEFYSIHKNYVVFFNLIPFDVWFVDRCARFIKKVHWGILICSPIASVTAILCFY